MTDGALAAPMVRISALFDPMARLLLLAVILAAALPATGQSLEWWRHMSNAAIFVLFLVNGLRIERREIARGLTRLGFFIPLAIWVFGVMALAGLGLAKLAQGALPPLMALGFLYLGTMPSTVQSATSYTMLGRGNVALSVICAALISILGVFVSAPLFAVLGGGAVAEVGSETVVRIAVLLILPLLLGLAIQNRTQRWVAAQRANLVWLDRIVIALAVYVAFSGAVEQGIGARVSAVGWVWLFAFAGVYLAFANIGAWLVSEWLGYPLADRIAFLFAASQKSVAIGAPLAALLFRPQDAGFVIAPLLLYHLLQLIIAAPIAARLAALSSTPADCAD